MFIRADIEKCSEAGNDFDVQVLPSVMLLEQNQDSGHEYSIISTHFGMQVTRVKDEVESWLNFGETSFEDQKGR